MKKTTKEGVTCVYDTEGILIAIIHKENKTHNNIFYGCSKMGMEELEELLGADVIKTKGNETKES